MTITRLPRKAGWTERDDTRTEGSVVKEVSEYEYFRWGDYAKKVQLIKLHKVGGRTCKKPEYVIRFVYYYKNHGSPDKKYRWGSQNTLIVSPANFRKLIRGAGKNGFLDEKWSV